jgi:hypothetical protein
MSNRNRVGRRKKRGTAQLPHMTIRFMFAASVGSAVVAIGPGARPGLPFAPVTPLPRKRLLNKIHYRLRIA